MAMGAISAPHIPFFMQLPHLNGHRQLVPVKTEASASPDLSPDPHSLHQYQFKFNTPTTSISSHAHGTFAQSHNPSESSSCLIPQPVYRFGSEAIRSRYNVASGHTSWPPLSLPNNLNSRQQDVNVNQRYSEPRPYPTHSDYSRPSMSYSDEYDNASDLADIVGDAGHGGAYGDSSGNLANDKAIRRRSSKACDQCRKSKCKCERSGPNEPCKSCLLLGTSCTFLGPSRKRGPPKGYIDAIEARLHQTEALVGIMLATKDPRARSLLEDISKDPFGRQIINRVDNSPYGVKGRKRDGNPAGPKSRGSGSDSSATPVDASGKVDLTSTHPSNEWQDRVTAMLDAPLPEDPEPVDDGVEDDGGGEDTVQPSPKYVGPSKPDLRVALSIDPTRPASSGTQSSDDIDIQSPARRQRRRVGDHEFSASHSLYPASANASAASLVCAPNSVRVLRHTYSSLSPINPSARAERGASVDSVSSDSEDDLTGAVGQLSLNEDEQVRYHGKASGLHLLNDKVRVDGRNEGGIWRFPKARVWPLAAPGSSTTPEDDIFATYLPSQAVQDRLLALYFRFIHSAFPVIHKRAFYDAYRHNGRVSSDSDSALTNRSHRRVPTILLLTIFSLAARYDESTPLPPDSSMMWQAGDEYLDKAKIILDKAYSSSRPATCQSLLLMGYREVGIGAMAQAWTYIGMAIRMAQDLGMHRSADGWARVGLGGRLFNEWELQERKRIWYGCVIMDKYISTYIGRPLMIFERDFDTSLPSEDDPEELELWSDEETSEHSVALPCHRISCFNASSTLSGILSTIVQAIYAVRAVSSRYAESIVLEGLLDRWYLDLPEHLRYEANSPDKETPLPHVLTLHMQYWCAVLLLHRPFIRSTFELKDKGNEVEDSEAAGIAAKSYELCAGAANHITSIASVYAEKYPLNRCSVFLCYYLFTASIMHITTLTTYPSDPQAPMGLKKCMDALEMIEMVWPSAGRALELLRGAKLNLQGSEYLTHPQPARQKRSADYDLDDSDHLNGRFFNAPSENTPSTRPNGLGTNYMYPTTNVYIPHATPNPSHHHPHTSDLSPMSASSPTSYRWQPEDFHPNQTFAATGSLSTSVLPQLYSTGFSNDRTHVSHSRQQSQNDSNPHHSQPSRYPQYWNDYTTYPQLGQAYPEPPHGSHQSLSPQVYIQDHYNLYDSHTFPDR